MAVGINREAALDTVRRVFSDLRGEYELPDSQVESWRWDEPTATLSWSDGIDRNVHARIEDEALTVEVNGWDDITATEDGEERVVRLWTHEVVDSVEVHDISGIEDAVRGAFDIATDVSRSDLTNEKRLS